MWFSWNGMFCWSEYLLWDQLISANKRQPQNEACDSIGVDWEMREEAGVECSAIKSQALIWFFCVYEKSKWKLMHPLRRQALSSLTLVGDLCMPIATQALMPLSGSRETVHHHLVALVEQDKAPPSFPHVAQKPGRAASGASSDWYCNVLDITRSCLHPCPWMDVMSAVIMGLLCQTYRAGLQNRHFALLTPRGETASSLITMARNCGPVVLSQSQDPVSFALSWHCKLGSQIMAPCPLLQKQYLYLCKRTTTRSKQHTSRAVVALQPAILPLRDGVLRRMGSIVQTISYTNPSYNSQILSWLPRLRA